MLTPRAQIGYGSNKKTKYMMPSGHKAFVVNNTNDVELLLMHNRTHAAEYVLLAPDPFLLRGTRRSAFRFFLLPPVRERKTSLTRYRIAHNVSARKRIDIIARAKQLGVKVTNPKAKVTTEV